MTRFQHVLLASAFSLAFLASQAVYAQTANSTSNSGAAANSGSVSGSRSSSVSGGGGGGNATSATSAQQGVTFNQTSNSSPNTTANNTDRITGGTSNTNQNSNSGYTSSDNIVRTTPTVYAPPVSGGNPCTLAVSGGVSVIGWGAAAGGTFVDEACANRQKIAMVWNAGLKDIAFELMCNDRDTYNAAKMAPGQKCSFRPQFEPAGAAPQPMVQQQPVPIGPAPQRVTTSAPFQPAGRFACLDNRGREVPPGTPGASCGQI
jgi:hypothetical protein